jgi:hypothetical protein
LKDLLGNLKDVVIGNKVWLGLLNIKMIALESMDANLVMQMIPAHLLK